MYPSLPFNRRFRFFGLFAVPLNLLLVLPPYFSMNLRFQSCYRNPNESCQRFFKIPFNSIILHLPTASILGLSEPCPAQLPSRPKKWKRSTEGPAHWDIHWRSRSLCQSPTALGTPHNILH